MAAASVTFTAEELMALDVESSKVVDLERFTPRGDIDPVYLDSPYYLYPDGPIAVEALRVIGAAMTEAGVAGLETAGPGCYDAVAIVRAAGFRMLVMSRNRHAAIVP
jgi:non-homologous end joining protein Ku